MAEAMSSGPEEIMSTSREKKECRMHASRYQERKSKKNFQRKTL
jgi:hypothetical protein